MLRLLLLIGLSWLTASLLVARLCFAPAEARIAPWRRPHLDGLASRRRD